MDIKVKQTEVQPDLMTQLREYLEKQGYEVTEDAKLLGKSELEHTFDMLAQKHDGIQSLSLFK